MPRAATSLAAQYGIVLNRGETLVSPPTVVQSTPRAAPQRGPLPVSESEIPNEILHARIGTPHEAIDALWDYRKLRSHHRLFDIGCGDAEVLIRACKRFGCDGVGVEINKVTAALARSRVAAAGLGDAITIAEDDATTFDRLDEADVSYVYLYPQTLSKLMPRFRNFRTGALVISYMHALPDGFDDVYRCQIGNVEHVWYFWRVPGDVPPFAVDRADFFR